jgi:hypothetical protein
MAFPEGVNVWYFESLGDRTQLNQYYSILKLLPSALVFCCFSLSIGSRCLNRFADLVKTCLEVK